MSILTIDSSSNRPDTLNVDVSAQAAQMRELMQDSDYESGAMGPGDLGLDD